MFKSRRLLAAGLAAAALLAGAAMVPAHAQAIAAPAGDTGFWGSLNGPLGAALATAVTTAIGWGAVRLHKATGVTIKAGLTQEVRDTVLTGIYQGAHLAEMKIDAALPAAKRSELIGEGVEWAYKRLPGPAGAIAKLALPKEAVEAIATKMLGQAIAAAGQALPAAAASLAGKA